MDRCERRPERLLIAENAGTVHFGGNRAVRLLFGMGLENLTERLGHWAGGVPRAAGSDSSRMVRNSTTYVSYKDLKKACAGLKEIIRIRMETPVPQPPGLFGG
ncbi:MAG: hypothetical protein LBB61_00260 [Treponema sp.]|jgi:hypothetical protein|nr:hypothetical protein [Treponema sp.]